VTAAAQNGERLLRHAAAEGNAMASQMLGPNSRLASRPR
jgi:hypothetical protein